MGQSASSGNGGAVSNQNTVLELFTKHQLSDLFQWRMMHSLSKDELASIALRLNITTAGDPSVVITRTDLAFLLQLSNEKDKDVGSVHESFSYVVALLYESFKVLGKLPFLRDSLDSYHDSQLTLGSLLASSVVHLGRFRRVVQDYDYLKLVFISFAIGCQKPAPPNEKSVDPEKLVHTVDEQYVVEAVKLPPHHLEDTNIDTTSRRIKWSTFKTLQNYDEIEIEALEIPAYDLVQLFTLLLIISSVTEKGHAEMQKQLQRNLLAKWTEFEASALSLLKYIRIDITNHNLKTASIRYDQFKEAMDTGMREFISLNMAKLFKYGLLSSIVADPDDNDEKAEPEKPKGHKFQETRLVTDATIALLTVLLQNSGVRASISTQNLVELYNGSNTGFSIRSLELKIFKWQAPTIFLISGKRLKSKTMAINKRYQQFDAEFPRFFRSTEDPNKSWQTDQDRVTYAVYVNEPWRHSNKKNFGDVSTAIMCLLPRYDFFTSKHDPVIEGKLIYFNNLGMGVGFGNDQPVNKNNVRKYLPGSISLTVEANLEFGVFRHIVNASANSAAYFNKSEQQTAQTEDYEDRFMITDLEVWGVGSTKELDEQKKQWEWEEKQAKARQSVNIRNMGEERAFLEMAGLVGGHAQGGSM